MRLFIIGNGGVGSWLVPKLEKLCAIHESIVLVDGDTLEKKNLDRQLFGDDQIGMNKAEALFLKYPGRAMTRFVPEYFSSSLASQERLDAGDLLFCCADNNPCRRAVMEACDDYGCRSIIGANEYTDAEAYWYDASFAGTPNDPRVFYPSIRSDHSGDPLGPPGCTGAAAIASPQLVLANDWASALMTQLFWFHTRERDEFIETPEFWPVHHKVNKFKFTTIRKGDRA